jgi:anti-sigma B factor antagonist
MNISVDRVGNISVIKINGNIQYYDIDDFADAVNTEIKDGFRKFVFNLENMPYLNSAVIGKFVELILKIKNAGGSAVFCNVRPYVKNILKITKLSEMFPVYSSLAEAIKNV